MDISTYTVDMTVDDLHQPGYPPRILSLSRTEPDSSYLALTSFCSSIANHIHPA